MQIIRAFLFYFFLVFYAILSLPMFLLAFWVVKENKFTRLYAASWGYFMLFILKKINRLKYRLHNFEILHKQTTPVIIACKHQSMFETILLFCEFHDKAHFVLKKELLRFPVFGSLIKHMKMISIDREKPFKAIAQMVKQSNQVVAHNGWIVIFPEGTRVKVGEVVKYSEGVYVLYERLKIPVVPVGLNSGVFWPKRSFLKKSGTIDVRVGEPIMPGHPREEFFKLMVNSIETLSQ